jgi:hypothetical protein
VRALILLSMLLLTTGCTLCTLQVRSEYINKQSLASVYVETPDPRKACPNLGEKVVIDWVLPKSYLNCQELKMVLTVRLKNGEVHQMAFPITKFFGSSTYFLLNDDYFTSGGILTYKVDVVGDGTVLESWTHQLWCELIEFD